MLGVDYSASTLSPPVTHPLSRPSVSSNTASSSVPVPEQKRRGVISTAPPITHSLSLDQGQLKDKAQQSGGTSKSIARAHPIFSHGFVLFCRQNRSSTAEKLSVISKPNSSKLNSGTRKQRCLQRHQINASPRKAWKSNKKAAASS
uniref:(northern house mosquito) hypothetical protein n=1 Tax=Culex pipiens TaxID=7175 RepID=A0A8D8DJC5_CULPI